jgi:hypothetical protein
VLVILLLRHHAPDEAARARWVRLLLNLVDWKKLSFPFCPKYGYSRNKDDCGKLELQRNVFTIFYMSVLLVSKLRLQNQVVRVFFSRTIKLLSCFVGVGYAILLGV